MNARDQLVQPLCFVNDRLDANSRCQSLDLPGRIRGLVTVYTTNALTEIYQVEQSPSVRSLTDAKETCPKSSRNA